MGPKTGQNTYIYQRGSRTHECTLRSERLLSLISHLHALIHKYVEVDIILINSISSTCPHPRKLGNSMFFCLFCFLRRDGYPNAIILVITNCLTPEKSSCPREGRDHLKVGISGHLLPALPFFSTNSPPSSLSHTPGCITPIHQPGCGVTSSGSLSWPI